MRSSYCQNVVAELVKLHAHKLAWHDKDALQVPKCKGKYAQRVVVNIIPLERSASRVT